MRLETAITELRHSASKPMPGVRLASSEHVAWKAKVDAMMAAALGSDSPTLTKFRELRYHVGLWTGAPGEAAEDAGQPKAPSFARADTHPVGLPDLLTNPSADTLRAWSTSSLQSPLPRH